MASGQVFPIIHCRDIRATRHFYEHVLGGALAYQFPDDGEAVFLTLTIGSGTIALAVGTDKAMYGETPLPATGHAVDVCIYVSDLDRTVAAARGLGAAVPVEPADMPWGERIAYLRDPEGTMLLVIQDP